MLKKLALSTAVIVLTAAAAHALETPTSAEQCHKLLDEVTQGTDPAKLGDEMLGKLDALMTKAEGECEAGKFADVVKTAEAIKSALTAKN